MINDDSFLTLLDLMEKVQSGHCSCRKAAHMIICMNEPSEERYEWVFNTETYEYYLADAKTGRPV